MRKLLPLSTVLRTEFLRFLGFLCILVFIATSLASLRVEDRKFLHADSGITEADLASLSENKNQFSRIWNFIEGISTGNLGKTVSGEDVSAHLISRFLPTLHLAVFSVLWASIVAILFSLANVFFQLRMLSSILSFISNVILSTPIFVACVLLILLFFSTWNLLPPGGYEAGNTFYVILPGLALGMRVFARLYLFTNSEVIDEFKSSYTLILKSRGYSLQRIIFVHIFRKVFPVIIIYILLDFSSLMSGAMVAEEIFFFPGVGKSMYAAIKVMDENLLSALLFYSGMVFYLFNRIAYWMQSVLKGNL